MATLQFFTAHLLILQLVIFIISDLLQNIYILVCYDSQRFLVFSYIKFLINIVEDETWRPPYTKAENKEESLRILRGILSSNNVISSDIFSCSIVILIS